MRAWGAGGWRERVGGCAPCMHAYRYVQVLGGASAACDQGCWARDAKSPIQLRGC